MLEAVIFDVDGTLVDTADFHMEAWQRALREFAQGNPVPLKCPRL
jgi:beta-phosphoglucomutase-like phosphatase (HAD superfamily)